MLSRLTANLVLEAEGNPPPGMVTVGIPTAKCRPFVWRHQQTNAKTLQLYRPETELLVNTSEAFDAIDLSFTETHLLKVVETLKFSDAYKSLKHGRIDLSSKNWPARRPCSLFLSISPRSSGNNSGLR